ncbi:hypothetical protein [Sorangium cellulosum]|uniref:hypothetical protein n=1 Tax=Sorangium cellulosum TaxID=56 RepID=UPI0012FF6F6A|nr:hypothetical protein [Sorangium cellulosum]
MILHIDGARSAAKLDSDEATIPYRRVLLKGEGTTPDTMIDAGEVSIDLTRPQHHVFENVPAGTYRAIVLLLSARGGVWRSGSATGHPSWERLEITTSALVIPSAETGLAVQIDLDPDAIVCKHAASDRDDDDNSEGCRSWHPGCDRDDDNGHHDHDGHHHGDGHHDHDGHHHGDGHHDHDGHHHGDDDHHHDHDGDRDHHGDHDDGKHAQGLSCRHHVAVHARVRTHHLVLPEGARLPGRLVNQPIVARLADLPEGTRIDLGDGYAVLLDQRAACDAGQTVTIGRVRDEGAPPIVAGDSILATPHQELCGPATITMPTGGRRGGAIYRNNIEATPTTFDGPVVSTETNRFSLYNYQTCNDLPKDLRAGGHQWCFDLMVGNDVVRDAFLATCTGDTMGPRTFCTCDEAPPSQIDACRGDGVPADEVGDLCVDKGNTDVRRAIASSATAQIQKDSPISTTRAAFGAGRWETDLDDGDGSSLLSASQAAVNASPEGRDVAVARARTAVAATYTNSSDADALAEHIVRRVEEGAFDPNRGGVDPARLTASDAKLLQALAFRAQCREWQERTAIEAARSVGAEIRTYRYEDAHLAALQPEQHRAGTGGYKGSSHAVLVTEILHSSTKGPLLYRVVEANVGDEFNQPRGQLPWKRRVSDRTLSPTEIKDFSIASYDQVPENDACQPAGTGSAGASSCAGFPDTNSSDQVLGAAEGADASDKLHCAGVLEGYFERCPETIDAATHERLCPSDTSSHPGKYVMCGRCRLSRAESLAVGAKALLNDARRAEVSGCAEAGTCPKWELCTEAQSGALRVTDWPASFIGWGIQQGYFQGDGNPSPGSYRPCRPHDAALAIEALTFAARLTGLPADERRSNLIDVHAEMAAIERTIADAEQTRGTNCQLSSVKEDGYFVPTMVAMNNKNVLCMPTSDGKRTANLCSEGDVGSCFATRYLMAEVIARLRGDIPTLECDPIEASPSALICE